MLSPYRYNSQAVGSMTSGKPLLITGGGGGGSGTVTSVNQSLAKDATETLSGGPITTSGTLARTAVDAGSDKIVFWDDSADQKDYLTLGSGISITGTTLNATGSGGTVTSAAETLAKDLTETITGSPITSTGTFARTAADAGSDKIVFWDDSADQKDYLTIGSGLSITGTTLSATGGGGITIDTTAITSGTAGRVLFESATNKVSEDSGFSYDASGNFLDVGVLRIAQTGELSNPTVAGNGITFSAGRSGITGSVATQSGGSTGGHVQFDAGRGGPTGDGGIINITGGLSGSTSGNGGDVFLNGGTSVTATGGGINLTCGDGLGGAGVGGSMVFILGGGTSGGGSFTLRDGPATKVMSWEFATGTLISTFHQGKFKSSDASSGVSGTFTGVNTITVKDGIITNIA